MSVFSNKRYRARILLMLALILLGWFLGPGVLSRYNTAQGRPYLFPGVQGPEGSFCRHDTSSDTPGALWDTFQKPLGGACYGSRVELAWPGAWL